MKVYITGNIVKRPYLHKVNHNTLKGLKKKKGKKGRASAEDVMDQATTEGTEKKGKKGRNKKSSTNMVGSQISLGKKKKGKKSLEVHVNNRLYCMNLLFYLYHLARSI